MVFSPIVSSPESRPSKIRIPQAFRRGSNSKIINLKPEYNVHESAVFTYKLKSYNAALDIMVAKEKLHFRKDTKFETWKKYGLKGVRIHLVDGNHDDMILPPNSAGFALKLQNILDKNLDILTVKIIGRL